MWKGGVVINRFFAYGLNGRTDRQEKDDKQIVGNQTWSNGFGERVILDLKLFVNFYINLEAYFNFY